MQKQPIRPLSTPKIVYRPTPNIPWVHDFVNKTYGWAKKLQRCMVLRTCMKQPSTSFDFLHFHALYDRRVMAATSNGWSDLYGYRIQTDVRRLDIWMQAFFWNSHNYKLKFKTESPTFDSKAEISYKSTRVSKRRTLLCIKSWFNQSRIFQAAYITNSYTERITGVKNKVRKRD